MKFFSRWVGERWSLSSLTYLLSPMVSESLTHELSPMEKQWRCNTGMSCVAYDLLDAHVRQSVNDMYHSNVNEWLDIIWCTCATPVRHDSFHECESRDAHGTWDSLDAHGTHLMHMCDSCATRLILWVWVTWCTLIERNPPPGGVSYLLCSLIKNRE